MSPDRLQWTPRILLLAATDLKVLTGIKNGARDAWAPTQNTGIEVVRSGA